MQLEWMARLLFAQGVILLFLLMNIVSFSIPHAGDFKPFFLLMAVYYWSIYRPTLIPLLYVFLLGIGMDLLAGLPLGLSALVLVGVHAVVGRQRLFMTGQPFIVIWAGFAVVAAAQMALQWLVISISEGVWVTPLGMIIAFALNVLLFPLASLVLLGVHKLLPLPQAPFIR